MRFWIWEWFDFRLLILRSSCNLFACHILSFPSRIGQNVGALPISIYLLPWNTTTTDKKPSISQKKKKNFWLHKTTFSTDELKVVYISDLKPLIVSIDLIWKFKIVEWFYFPYLVYYFILHFSSSFFVSPFYINRLMRNWYWF